MNEKHPKNQLDTVICQIRFPALLSIERDVVDFQEYINDEYPLLGQTTNAFEGVADIPATKNYVFNNPDRTWSVSVSVATVSLATNRYVNWEDFFSRFDFIIKGIRHCFKIRGISRIGLRYVNAIKPSSLGFDNGDITKVVKERFHKQNPCKVGELIGFNTAVDFGFEDGIVCHSVYGTIHFTDGSNETGVRIDNDVYLFREISFNEVPVLLNRFNAISKDIFCCYVTDEIQKKVGL